MIVNEGYSSNLGDQAIKESMETLMHSLGFDTDFCYFTNPQLQALPVYNYENIKELQTGFISAIKKKLASVFSIFIYCRYFFRLKKEVKVKLQNQQYDKVIIGGGQLINSSDKRRISFFAIAIYVWATEIKKNQSLPLYLIGVGAAGKFHTIEKYLYKTALRNVSAIWVRDTFSSASILKYFHKQSVLIPDVAFFDQAASHPYKKENIALVGIYSYQEYVEKFSVTEKNKDAYYEHWKAAVEKFINEGKKVTLFYTTVTDADETQLFKKYLDNQNIKTSIATVNTLLDLNNLLQTASSVYSARMHALILALKKGCHVEAYIVSQKLKSFTDEYIKPDIDIKVMSDRLHQTFETAFKPALQPTVN